MEKVKNIVTKALEKLQTQTGFTAEWTQLENTIDGKLNLKLQGRKYQTYATVKRELRQYQLDQILNYAKEYKPIIVIAEHIFPAIKERLREEKIGYIDIAGNIFINDGDIYVWIDGNKPNKKIKRVTNRAFTKAGLRTVFYLLLHEVAINMPYRQLAQNTGVAVGNIQNVLEGLKDAGFIMHKNKQEKVLHNKKALLHRWIDGYRETLKPALHIGNFEFLNNDSFQNWKKLEMPDPEIVKAQWGGEPAAEEMTKYLNPQQLTLYIKKNTTLFLTKWKLVPNEKGDLLIYEKFWHNEPENNDKLVPPLLVYADLIITDDPRCIETAAIIYDKYLKTQYEPN